MLCKVRSWAWELDAAGEADDPDGPEADEEADGVVDLGDKDDAADGEAEAAPEAELDGDSEEESKEEEVKEEELEGELEGE